MICKVVEEEVETDDLIWQPPGANSALKTGPPVAFAQPHNPALAGGPAHDPGLFNSDRDVESLRSRVAELEAQRGREVDQARQNGLEQGLRQGRQEAATEMQDALDRLARTIHEVAQVKKKVRNDAENELVKLSLAIAQRILHREITTDPQSLRGVVYAALQRLQNREITRIRVFPASVPAVRAALERNGGMAAIEIVADGLLQPGGLVFETSLGELDASVETQLQEIERGFADRLQLR
jgi:flagellar biosynthesis/type III secretory pathway protein FliH